MPQIIKSQELRRENQALWARMNTLNQKAFDEKRDFTAEETQQYDKMRADFKARDGQIQRCEELEREEASFEQLDTRRAGRDGGLPNGDGRHGTNHVERRAKELKALRAFITMRPDQWDADTRNLIVAQQADIPDEARAMGVGYVLAGKRSEAFEGDFRERNSRERRKELRALTAAGNATVAEDFMRELDIALKDFSGMAQIARMVNTDTGADMPFPTMDDTGNIGALLAEGSQAVDNADPTLAAVTLQAFLYTSKIVRVPNQLMQDSGFSVDGYLPKALGIRLGRILNSHATKGTGSSQPRGLITAILADTTQVTAASATAISFADIVKLFHSVDPAYRNGPNVAWMMNDAILEIVEKILDSNGRPIFRPATDAPGSVATIYNKPVVINQDMDATVVEDNESIVFGDFDHYIIRRALNPVLIRLNELYAAFFQTGFVMFERWDGDLVGGAGRVLRLLSHNLV